MNDEAILQHAQRVLKIEAEAISNIPLENSFIAAVKLIASCKGKVFTTGLGKAGYVARKVASTFCTTGTPSVFVHPGDASHGDVGVVSAGDLLIAYSNSGHTREVVETAKFCRKLGVLGIITLSGKSDSPMAQQSDVLINLGILEEACPLGFTPSTSTTVMAAVSDALAFVVMEQKGFKREDFALRHHGGYLGQVSRSS